jgi:hypothetical protein
MSNFPLATIPSTEVRTLRSAIVDQEYLISVALPFRYAEHPDKTYPVIYVLDANMSFGIVVETMRLLNIRVPWSKEFPDTILVGIGYPLSGSLAEIYHQMLHLRMRDFLPKRDVEAEKFIQETFPVSESVISGGASHFLQFIQHELIPMIEAEYRADPTDRTLMGHSWGGLFALYALFAQPQLFQRCIAGSADLPHDQGYLLRTEAAFAQEHHALPVNLYMAFAKEELDSYKLPFVTPFVDTLKQRHYTGFKFTYETLPTCTHGGALPGTYSAGLYTVFT